MLLCKFSDCPYNEQSIWCLRSAPALNRMGLCNYMYNKNGQQKLQAFQPVNDRLDLNIVEGDWKDVGTEPDAAIDGTTDDGFTADVRVSTGMSASDEKQNGLAGDEKSRDNDNA